jgi:hypothetical protein
MMFWWLLVGCPKRDVDPAVRRDELLKLADAAWERRADVGFEGASAPLLEAYGIAPTFPGVLWRIARLRTGEGMAAEDPDVARSAFAEARSTGAACLEGQSGFVEQRVAGGWAAALAAVTPDRTPCVAWTAFAWVRWMEIQGGAAASLDLESIDALIARVVETPDPDVQRVTVWAEGLLFAVRPTWAGRDYTAARERLERAIRLNRKELGPLVDLYGIALAVGTPDAQAALSHRILSERATTPEDLRAIARLEAADLP